MYVKKFESDSLDNALKEIKRELGPDAIILKTITNKGLKGAFKKNRIEITAAISEKSYGKKLNVDQVLSEEQQDDFYSSNASNISHQLDNYSGNAGQKGYGGLGLNRVVQKTKDALKSSLDDFLGEEEIDQIENNYDQSQRKPLRENYTKNIVHEFENERQEQSENPRDFKHRESSQYEVQGQIEKKFNQDFERQEEKINQLEESLYALQRQVSLIAENDPHGIKFLRTNLKSLDIDEDYIQSLVKKISFEFSDEDLGNTDTIFEFAIREMAKEFKTAMPLFSSTDVAERPVITVFISEAASGQTSMALKLAALQKGSKLIMMDDHTQNANLISNIYKIDINTASSISEIISHTRRAVEKNQKVFIDFKNPRGDYDETKKFIDGLRRAFQDVEVLVSLSAIHTEVYNRNQLNKFGAFSDGIVCSHLDFCLNFGALFNLNHSFHHLPYKFFGTGNIIPEDIEGASSERLLASLFKL